MEANNATNNDELPAIHYTEATDNSVTAVFENGAKLRYTKEEDNRIFEEVFAPSDADSVMERTHVLDGGHLDEILRESSNYYEQYETRGELMQDWSTLGEWITHN